MKKIITILFVLAFLPASLLTQWTQITSPTTSNLYGLYFTTANTGIIGGVLGGGVLYTSNGGNSFTNRPTGAMPGSWYLDVYFVNSLTGFASGNNGYIAKTTNGGLNWMLVASGGIYWHSIFFPSTTTGYAVGSNSIIKSTNSGNNWFQLNNPFGYYLLGVYFLNNLTGFICGGDNSLIAKTTDGGQTWINQSISFSDYYEEVVFLDLNTGYVAGNYGKILKTTNGGNNWVYLNSNTTTWLFDINMLNANTGWVCGKNGLIMKTTNGGLNWNTQPTGITNWIRQIDFADANTGYAVCDGGIILKTTNGGSPTSCFVKETNDPIVNDYAWSEGCAWGDYDNDGDLDLVVTAFNDGSWTSNYPILLYRQDPTGFTKILNGPIATEVTRSFGCAWGDYDNDGKLDLFVCTGFGLNNLLFHNLGGGNFEKVTTGQIVNDGGSSVACAWLDYDRDGRIDLFVVNQGNDFLYHNIGNGAFAKITNGDIVNDNLNGRSCAVGDFDNDGYPDIFVTNFSAEPNLLYHNNGNGTFTLTTGVIPPFSAYSSGAAFGDYDNDGWLDLMVTNHNQQNILYHNNGNNTFSQIFSGPGGESINYSFGCTWLDYNNDGYLDLFVSNRGTPNLLYKNLGGGNFQKIIESPITTETVYGIGNTAADVNLDGKMDIFVANNGFSTPNNDLYYKNTCSGIGNYVGIKLKGGCTSNKDGIGARIIAKVGINTYIREVAINGYHSENMLWQHFGLGSAIKVDTLIVKWPSGNIQRIINLAANQYVTIDECLIGIKVNNSEIPTEFMLNQNCPNPFNPTTKINYQLPKRAFVTLKIYSSTGNEVATLINASQEAGYYDIDFNGENLSSGVYYYKITAGSYSETKKMVLIK